MARKKPTARNVPDEPKDVPVYDLGDGVTRPRGTEVWVKEAPRLSGPGTDPQFHGTLYSVDYRDGVPFTVCIYDGERFRSVYVDRVSLERPRRRREEMALRAREAMQAIYGTDEPTDKNAAERRAAIAKRINRTRSGAESEKEMTKALREKAEALTASELKAALKKAGVTGYSKFKHAELVDAYVAANKPKKERKTRTVSADRELSENQDRVPNPIEWVSDDGEYSGASPSANWNGSRWQIGKYLYAQGYDKADVKEAFAEAKAKLLDGAKKVTVCNVTISVIK